MGRGATFPITFELAYGDFISAKKVVKVDYIDFPIYVSSVRAIFVKEGCVTVIGRGIRYDEDTHGKKEIYKISGRCSIND